MDLGDKGFELLKKLASLAQARERREPFRLDSRLDRAGTGGPRDYIDE